MDSCVLIEQYKKSLLELTNSCNLTIGMARYIVKEIYDELTVVYKQQLQEEIKQLKNGEVETEASISIGNVDDETGVSTHPQDITEEE